MNRRYTEYEIFDIAVHSYKYQHCGNSLFGECHLKPAYVRTARLAQAGLLNLDSLKQVDVSGGWHDAGDYGKYIPTAAVTVYQMLLLAEVFPSFVQKNPVLLDEIGFELSWMLKMQDEDGGVYHKVNTYDFCGMVMPCEDNEPQLLYEKSTAAAAYFTGSISYACRIMELNSSIAENPEFPSYSELFRAAIKAGLYLEKVLPGTHEVIPSVDHTGPYIPEDSNSLCYWAFAELYRLTGSNKWIELCCKFEEKVSGYVSGPMGWEDMSAAAVWALYSSGKAEFYKNRIIIEADRLCKCASDDAFGCALTDDEYLWGSNKFAAAYGLELILAACITEEPHRRAAYIDTAKKQLKYITGNNIEKKCFLTGVEECCVHNPHHRVVVAAAETLPGFLVGGPNDRAEDGIYEAGLGRRGYVDKTEAYSCNEYAIDYNAPLVFLSGALASLKEIKTGERYGIESAE